MLYYDDIWDRVKIWAYLDIINDRKGYVICKVTVGRV